MSRSRRTVRLLSAVVLFAAPFTVAGTAEARTAADTAFVRAAHLSPDTPKVDIYLTAFRGGTTRLWLSSVGYGDVSPYRRVEAGQYAVSMRPHGAKASTPAALRWTLTLRAGASYTAAAVGRQAKIHGIVVPDRVRTPAGQGSLRVVQAASSVPTVSVAVAGTPVSSGTRFGTVTPYVTVPAGRVTVRVTSAQGVAQSARLQVARGSATSVVLLDRQGGGLQVRALTDASGTRQQPSGAVPAGGGGAARARVDAQDDAAPYALVGFGAAVTLALLFGAWATLRRPARAR